MTKLTMEEVQKRKKSDTIFILGSGYSIKSVTAEQWKIIEKHDSIAFNWFCKHDFKPTFFLIREQSNLPARCNKDETPDILIKRVNRYQNSCAIICKVNHHTKKAYRYYRDERIWIPCVILKDDKSNRYRRLGNMKKNPANIGLIHGNCTLYNVLHFVKFMKYENIVFVGIDLYDSRYFWLPKSGTRHTLSKKKRSYKGKHPIARKTIGLVKKFNKKFATKLYVSNRKSLLSSVIPHKPIGDFA